MLEIVAKKGIYFHLAKPSSHTTPGSQRERERESASFSQITLPTRQIRANAPLRHRLVVGISLKIMD